MRYSRRNALNGEQVAIRAAFASHLHGGSEMAGHITGCLSRHKKLGQSNIK
ncbi:hypothetical protein [Nostoc sp. NMS4]|uniref:hypothetical protein n=1 Tax=Nostoc sp. NMS4 TaxID=2815390 RepID=UPI0025E93B71|nr:hypothetical protein [Nostoc sp. NMS4]MBN3926952.1 hypothetical protein [Nostoc sp. NMS4]